MTDEYISPEDLAVIQREQAQIAAWAAEAPGRFLEAWKGAVRLIGQDLFCAANGQMPVSCVDDATNKWQLAPDRVAIEHVLPVLSPGQALFLAQACSFFYPDWAQGLIYTYCPGKGSHGETSHRLDIEYNAVLAELGCNHSFVA